MIENCIFIGEYAGIDVTDADGVIIIGDNIRSVPKGVRVAIGETVQGHPINLDDILVSDFVDKPIESGRKWN